MYEGATVLPLIFICQPPALGNELGSPSWKCHLCALPVAAQALYYGILTTTAALHCLVEY